jgi:hypothetical protein
MKNKYFFYLSSIIILISSNELLAQKANTPNSEIRISENKIVQKLNAPTKIWINGGWEIKIDGTKVLKKGYWIFEEKTFQKKSEIFRQKLNERNKV